MVSENDNSYEIMQNDSSFKQGYEEARKIGNRTERFSKLCLLLKYINSKGFEKFSPEIIQEFPPLISEIKTESGALKAEKKLSCPAVNEIIKKTEQNFNNIYNSKNSNEANIYTQYFYKKFEESNVIKDINKKFDYLSLLVRHVIRVGPEKYNEDILKKCKGITKEIRDHYKKYETNQIKSSFVEAITLRMDDLLDCGEKIRARL